MQVVKAVRQNYKPTLELLNLLDEFRKMVNDCIRIGLTENVTSLKSLSLKAYHQLYRYKVPTCYRLTAISKATGILRNYRKTLRKQPYAKKPYATKMMLTDCYSFKIKDGTLRLSLGNKNYVFIPLNNYTQATILGYTVRSVSLTTCTLSIAFSKETAEIEPAGLIGIDRNLDNITLAFSSGEVERFDLSKATKIKATYREVKSHFKRNDTRIQRRIFSKYGIKQRNRVNQILHCVSKEVVKQVKTRGFGIVMENLTGIRKLYRKGNGQGRKYRGRMNSWSYYELQRQIEYKAKWEGIPIVYVDTKGTSSNCSICESKLYSNEQRSLWCPKCSVIMDRDVNAARNVLQRGVRFAPVGLAKEAMGKESSQEVILKVDASQLTPRAKS